MSIPPSSLDSDPAVMVGMHLGGSDSDRRSDAAESLSGSAAKGGTPRRSEPSPPVDTERSHDAAGTPLALTLVESMVSAANRTEAAEALAKTLESRLRDGSAQCGIGRRQLARLFDSRFGWLGPENRLHEQAQTRWQLDGGVELDPTGVDPPKRDEAKRDEPKRDEPRRDQLDADPHATCNATSARSLTDTAECRRRSRETIELRLPQPGRDGCCVVWFPGDAWEDSDVAELGRSASVLAASFWSRPAMSLPDVGSRLGRRSKIAFGVIAASLLLIAMWPVHYRVACVARAETLRQRLIAAPFEASLLESRVRPGDAVKAGDVLLVLDGRPLRLERESIEAELQQVSKEHDVALAGGRVADAQQAKLRHRKLQRRYQLLSDRLDRLEVISPIDGIVVTGDLHRYVGTTLDLGQTLLEIAPLHTMVIELEIPAHEIGYVASNAESRIRIDAVGGRSIRLPLDDLFPTAEIRDDRNVFIGRVEVDNRDLNLMPGMRGEAVIYGPLRPWIWSWVRGGVERALWWIGY